MLKHNVLNPNSYESAVTEIMTVECKKKLEDAIQYILQKDGGCLPIAS